MFEEALNNIIESRESGIPSYMTAADTLSVANGNPTFLESAADVVDSIPKFIGLSLMSGINQVQNIPANVGNMLGGDFEVTTTDDIIAGLDDDLGQFYQEHREGIDLVGFLASSAIPGTAGVKVLNAGQRALNAAAKAGKLGTGMGKSMGLLATPMPQTAMATAVKQVATNSSIASLTNANALKAIAAGAGQGFYEAAAFEIAVAATMQSSPIMKNQDFGDLMSNIAFSGGVFGIASGVIQAAKLNSALKGARDTAELAARPWKHIEAPAAASSLYERIALHYEQLNAIPGVPKDLDPSRIAYLEAASASKANKLELLIRKDLGELARGDEEVATVMLRTLKGLSKDDQLGATIGAIEMSRMEVSSKAVKKMNKLLKKQAEGKPLTLADEEAILMSNLKESYIKVHGENTGIVFSERPVQTMLVDTLKAGESIGVTKTGRVMVGKSVGGRVLGKEVAKFDLKANIPSKFKVGKNSTPAKHFNIFTASPMETNARYIWASRLPTFKPTAADPLIIHIDDIPLMEKVLADFGGDASKMDHVRFVGFKKGDIDNAHINFHSFLGNQKIKIANRLLHTKGGQAVRAGEPIKNPLLQDEIAAIVNVRSKALSGEVSTGPASGPLQDIDMLAYQSYAKEYTDKMIANKVMKPEDGVVDILTVPQHIKVTYDPTKVNPKNPLAGINNHIIENMVIIKEQQRLYQLGTNNSAAEALGKWYDQLEDINAGYGNAENVANTVRDKANPSGAGASVAGAASGNYGSLASTVENIGNVTSRAIHEFKKKTTEVLEPLLHKLGNNREAAIEWSTLQQRVRSIEGEYALNEAGDALEPAVIVRWRKAAAEAAEKGEEFAQKMPALKNPNMELSIPLKTKEVRELAAAHIETNGERTRKLAGLRTSQGLRYNRGPDVFYPIPVDPKDYKYFAMVTDESITSGNQSKTLFATTDEELQSMIQKIKSDNPHLKVRTKKEAEDYFNAYGRWDYEKTLSSSYLDTAAHRKGVSAPLLVSTDPQKIVGDMLKWHMERETGLVREAISTKYEVAFEELKRLGDEFTNVGTSKFGSLNTEDFASDIVKNPYIDYIKTALNVRKTSDYPFLVNMNKLADEAISKMYKKIDAVRSRAKNPEELVEIQNILTQAGYKGAQYDESMEIFANLGPARGTLSNIVQKANSVMATVVLRWDTLNAVNNAVSANVLLGTETKAILRAINQGGEEAKKAIGALAYIKTPGTDQPIFSAQKLISNSIMKFGRVGRNSPEFKFYQDHGYMTRITDQYKNVLDDLAFNPAEGVTSWNTKINSAFKKAGELGDKGEILTGNRLAEEFNRFVAADVMKQISDVAVSRGLMTAKEQLAYINTFVNRTQGNYLAAQRPHMFQGPIGQAIGLFQTYQFNLMQQLLRHVGEGHSKDAMTLLALQGTIHGMNGLPAFNAVNTHIVGNASGNTTHRDLYDTAYGVVGKEAGDWLMYGAASNALGLLHPDLKINLYTRGDINPRHVTLVPTNPATVPIVQASAKFFGNLFETAGKLAAGGDISTTLLQGLEHNGLSRPLAGLAQTLEGINNPQYASYSTSNKGNIIAANDLLSLANLGRLAGGKPIDEAIAIDAAYRFKAYGLEDAARRAKLGEAIKTTMMAGENPTKDQIETFAQKYAETGGRQEDFNKWFASLYATANTSQANELSNNLNSPFSQSMQRIMGGREFKDFSSTTPE